MLEILAALAPLAAIAIAVLVGRASPLPAAAIGLAATVAAIALTGGSVLGSAVTAVPQALLIWLLPAAVILPGLVLAEAIARSPLSQDLSGWVGTWPIATPLWATVLVLGAAPMLEAATGFGLCLVLVLPALAARLPVLAAARIGVFAMATMPWGTAGLATIVAAVLAGLDADAVARVTAVVSAPVLIAAGAVVMRSAGGSWREVPLGAAIGAALAGAIALAAAWLGPQMAGIAGGAVVVAVAALLAGRAGLPPRSLWPFAVLVLGVVVWTRLPIGALWTPAFASVSVQPLTTPGPILALVACLLLARAPDQALATVRRGLARAIKPLATVAVVIVLGRLALSSGLLQPLATALATLPAPALAPAGALIGAASGWLTGSGVAGNALSQGLAVALDPVRPLLLVASHNAGAAHGAMSALGIAALISALSRLSPAESAAITATALRILILVTVPALCLGVVIASAITR